MKTIIRIIQIIWGAFLFIGCIAPLNDFDKLEFWISLIILASIVLIPLQIIYQFLDKKDIRKQQALDYYNGIKTDVKTCPNCRCQVNKIAVVCPNCNFHFVYAYRNQTIQAPKLDNENTAIIRGNSSPVPQKNMQRIAKKQLKQEQLMQTHVSLQISAGFQHIHVSSKTTMFQRHDGTVYFDKNVNEAYILLNYSWNGPHFDMVTKTVSTTNTKSKTKGKSGKIAGGAVVGTLLMPGIGTAVGALAGAGGRKKSKSHSTTINNDVHHSQELNTPATLRLKNLNTNEYINIVIACNTIVDSQIRCFQFMIEQAKNNQSNDAADSLKGIKALKELLDMGAITQEEFDTKKRQLLNK